MNVSPSIIFYINKQLKDRSACLLQKKLWSQLSEKYEVREIERVWSEKMRKGEEDLGNINKRVFVLVRWTVEVYTSQISCFFFHPYFLFFPALVSYSYIMIFSLCLLSFVLLQLVLFILLWLVIVEKLTANDRISLIFMIKFAELQNDWM